MAGIYSSSLLSCLLLLLLLCRLGPSASDDSLQDKCASDITKLLPCQDYASGSKEEPTSDCCSSVKDIRGSQPVCLCYVIQQTHSGSSAFKSLGLKVDRLVQLPTACKLANSSVSDCPKLLNLSRSSPDYSIFTNITTANTTSSGSADAAPSKAFIHSICLYGTFAIGLVTATFLSILS
ncbi:non-specific lipid transfer protein GPI-anchored 1-like [Musa acuminata AAA Group]|uniref:non-specific lipid transfer protein GPI-anchored 1-like n=1 Tax=Musa acuminata AAA Group TaxID=214697 RepID=UPI0031DF306A